MPLDLAVANSALAGLRPYPVAVTTVHEGRANGLMSLSGGAAGIIPEAPRATVSVTKYNFTHDLILHGGVFVIHVLGNAPELIDESLDIFMTLGGSSGRDGDKLGGLRTKPGVTGAPVLLGALTYVECRVTGCLDNDENSIFVGDVVAAERLNPGGRLTVAEAWSKLPASWIEAYERNHHAQVDHCRKMRHLPIPSREDPR